jgi:hypothetical protein
VSDKGQDFGANSALTLNYDSRQSLTRGCGHQCEPDRVATKPFVFPYASTYHPEIVS